MKNTVQYGQALADAIQATRLQIHALEGQGTPHADPQLVELKRQDLINTTARLIERIEAATADLKHALQDYAEQRDLRGDALFAAKHGFEHTTFNVTDLIGSLELFDHKNSIN